MSDELFKITPTVNRKLNLLPQNLENSQEGVVGRGRFPSWLHRQLPKGNVLGITSNILSKNRLHTVCEEAKCPNILECWSQKTATFLAMGKSCTRNCGFCDIDFSRAPHALDANEPSRVAQSVQELGLKHVVITMVARDDLEDGGAEHLAAIIREIKKTSHDATIEVLTSDFSGNFTAIDTILAEKPQVFNHNIETVRSLTPRVRHKATYERTLSVLHYAAKKDTSIKVKSGLMVGLGEAVQEVEKTLFDLKKVGVSMITIGQYLQPSRKKLLVKEFVTQEQFKAYEQFGQNLGMKMFCGPFVRSSYHAREILQ